MSDSVYLRRNMLATMVCEGAVDERVLGLIIPEGVPLQDEDVYWDYKKELPILGTGHKAVENAKTEHNLHMAEIVKDVAAFYNTYGGYLIVGIADDTKKLLGFSHIFDCDDLNKRVFGYTRQNIDCKFRKLEVKFRAISVTIGLLYIPQRPDGLDPAQFVKSAPQAINKRRAFEVDDIYLRERDQCRPANSAGDYAMLFQRGRRSLAANNIQESQGYIQNNLPAKDPNLLSFVGREDQLDKLWKWFTERQTAVKLLSGPGGVGKTSIAWMFCEAVTRTPPAGIEKVVWLTAKKKTYAGLLGRYVEIAHTRFEDLPTLLRALLSELGVPGDQLPDDITRDVLIDEVIENLKHWPCLLVVDDVDSLREEHQNDVFRAIDRIFDRVVASGHTRARALLTARLTLGAAPGQLLVVPGMPLPEFEEYVRISADGAGLSFEGNASIKNEVRRIHEASNGSPLFAASILRLVSLGESLGSAIKQFKGAEGEEVRRFAFERELGDLTDSQIRTLFAAINLGRTTFIELLDVTHSNRTVLRDDLGRLREYHLLSVAGSLSDTARAGPLVEVPPIIGSMLDIIRKRVRDPSRIESACARLRRESTDSVGEVGRLIRQVLAFWTDGDSDLALETARRAVKEHSDVADLWCLYGRSLLNIEVADAAAADAAFRKASERGCVRPELFPLWLEAKRQILDWVGVMQVAKEAEKAAPSPENIRTIAQAFRAMALEHEQSGAWRSAAEQYRNGALEIRDAFKDGRAYGLVLALRDLQYALATAYVASIDRGTDDPQEKIEVWLACIQIVEWKVVDRSAILLAVRRLEEWWNTALFRPRADHSTANKLREQLSELWTLQDTLICRGTSWLGLVKELKDASHRLNASLARYQRELSA